ncbi:MAG: response regulator [Candidatus Aminicenantes bacterium]|nr:response regulator [Candidatus Aminicenantes bacterium]
MKARILIVDDASIMRRILKNILVTNGYDVVGEASNGQEALELYRQLRPDLVTMDIVMPQVNGIQALKNILAHDKKAKIIMISVIDQRHALKEVIDAGACDFILKPFENERIISAIEDCLHPKSKDNKN